MKSKEIYQSIDQTKLKTVEGGEKAIANLKRVEKETKGFTEENPKFDVAMGRLYDLLKEKNPQVLKNVKVEEKVKEVKVPTTKTERKKDPKKKTKTVKKKVKEATGKKKVTKPTKTPSTPKERKVPFSTRAKQLADKEGITFKEARVKLSKQIKKEKNKIEENVKSDLDKLLAFVKSKKFEDGEKYPKTYGQQDPQTSNLSADAKRMAKPVGKRVSKNGKTYYEYRDNRSDRNSLPAPQGQYKYKGDAPPYLEAGGTLPTPFGQAGLVGETGAMNEMDMFAMGGDLPQGVHQYYANTYNPAYPTPHGYAKGGQIQMSDIYKVNGKDYLFSTPIQNDKGTYTGWDAYEVVYDTIDGEKHLNYAKTKRGKSKYFPNGVKRTEAEDYFAKGGEIDKNLTYKGNVIGFKDEGTGRAFLLGEIDIPKNSTFKSIIELAKSKFKRTWYVEVSKDGEYLYEIADDSYKGEYPMVTSYAKGGVIDAFNLQFIKDVPKTNLKVEQIDNKISYAKGGKIDTTKKGVYLMELKDGTFKVSNNLGDRDFPYEFNDVFPTKERAMKFANRVAKNSKSKVVEIKYAKGGSIKVGDKVKYPKATMVGKVTSIKDSDFERTLTIEYDDGKIINEGESSVIKFAKGGRTKSATNRDRKYYNSSESWEKSVDSKGRKRPTYKKRKSTKSQGFNDRLDESLEKSMGRRKYSTVKTMDKGNLEKRMPKKVKVFKSPQLSTKTKEMMISEDGRKVFIFENGMLYRTDSMGNKTQGQKMKETQYEVLSSESFADGGKIGFDALSKKVAKRYYNKAVPKKYQKEYGKTYSKSEAQEVGDKVASKVYRQQLKKN